METQAPLSLGDERVQAVIGVLRAAGFVVTGFLGFWKVRHDRRHARQLAEVTGAPGRSMAERLTAAEVRITHLETTHDDLKHAAQDLRALLDNLLLTLASAGDGEKSR